MVANYEIIDVVAIMQHLIDKFTIFFEKGLDKDAFSKQRNQKKSGLHFCLN